MRIRWGLASVVVVVSGIAAGAWALRDSPFFMLNEVEYAKFPAEAPLTLEEVEEIAEIPYKEASLFSVDLERIRERIVSHPWVKNVEIEKKFPGKLWIRILFREPVAILRAKDQTLYYLERDGSVFGPVEPSRKANLPLVSGISETDQIGLEEAIRLLDEWKRSGLELKTELASVHFDSERGYRLTVSYLSGSFSAKNLTKGRLIIELGHNTDALEGAPLKNLRRVFEYLGKGSVKAHQIFVGDGKKIVVRASRRS